MAIWQVNTTRLSDDAGLIIGILNTSPESFYDGCSVNCDFKYCGSLRNRDIVGSFWP